MTMKLGLKLAALATAVSALLWGCGPSKPVLNLYTWSDYIDENLVKEFEKQYNCKVVIDTFDSNEFMYAKLKAGGSGYDVIVPTSYMSKIMNDQKMLLNLDHSKLPNSKYIDKRYLDNLAIDKKMEYCIPYMLGYTCIAYNKEKLGDIPQTWEVFSNEKNKGRMTMLNDYRETIGAGLMFNGYSINTRNEKELEKAKEQVLKWKKNLAKFDNEVYKAGIQSGEFLVVQGYSGDLFQVLDESPNLSFMIPKEGVMIACDDMVIPASADNPELAYKFINFFMDPKNAAKNMEYTCYAAPIPEAKKYLPEELRTHPGMIFPEALFKAGQIIQDLGDDNAKYLKVWDEIKISQ